MQNAMDDFSKAILKEILPNDPIRLTKSKGHRPEDALDHLAAPILLERAAYLRKLAKVGDGSASEVLKQYSQHAIHLLVRSRNGGAEVHANFADLFFVLDGRATMVTGGTVTESRTIAPGETRGASLVGGSQQELRAGDLAHVPAGIPHQMLVSGEKFVTCLVVKIPQDAQEP